tara:strand:+ start:1813 stop:2880 length:1068 start_codon:yes stop_codon:yes gene_type:complete
LFIDKIKKITKKNNVLFTSNCTTALYLLFKSLNFKNRHIVIPGNICFDVILSIVFSGNIPIIIDTNDQLGFDIIDLKLNLKKIKNIGAIIFPYLHGNSDNFKDVLKLSKKNNLVLIEDIAGSFGGKIGNKYFGSFANFTVGSFGQGKIIDMNGGGFLATKDVSIFNDIKLKYTSLEKYNHVNKVLYFEINKIQNEIINKKKNKTIFNKKSLQQFFKAFIYNKKFNKQYFKKLNSLISQIDKINTTRNKKADYFEKIFNFRNFLPIKHKKGSVYWRKNFLVKNIDSFKVIKYLNKENIYARKYYPPLNYIFPFLRKKLVNYENYYKQLINFWVGEESNFKEIIQIKEIIEKKYNVN